MTKAEFDGLPQKTRDKLAVLAAPEWDGTVQLAIAPRFIPGTPRDLIAASFQFAVHHFVARNQFQADSPFVKGVLSALETYVAGGTYAPLGRNQLDFLSAAKTPLELEMADAIRLSLSE